MREMTVGSLFTGIGGMDLGLERAGMTIKWMVEKDEYCRRVLAKHWPDVTRYEDVHDVGRSNLEPVDLICGGFPCQPVSQAGKRLAQDDERWLWPEFARIIRELRPRYALMENVPGLLVRGVGDVLGDLAAMRYDAEWFSLPASAFGAPHLRWRVFLVGSLRKPSSGVSDTFTLGLREFWQRDREQRGIEGSPELGDDGENGDVAHTASPRRAEGLRRAGGSPRHGTRRPRPQRLGTEVADTDRAGCDGSRAGRVGQDAGPNGRNDTGGRGEVRDADREHESSIVDPRGRTYAEPTRGGWWTTEPDVGRVADGVPARVDRLRALGNAVVPQVAEWLGRRIMEARQAE